MLLVGDAEDADPAGRKHARQELDQGLGAGRGDHTGGRGGAVGCTGSILQRRRIRQAGPGVI